MSEEPRDPKTRTAVHRVADPEATRAASHLAQPAAGGPPPSPRTRRAAAPAPGPPRVATYLAQPGEVGRVLLLYSGGLDTSVMLKWIQDEYDAEVVALTVNLGQPGEDYEVVRGKALRRVGRECWGGEA